MGNWGIANTATPEEKLKSEMEILQQTGRTDDNLVALDTWWQGAKEMAAEDRPPVEEATLHGSRMALKLTAIVPAVMAVCYLILIGYFQSIGGYKPLSHDD